MAGLSAPRGLEQAGRRLWKAVTSAYLFRPDELVLLENACRTVDFIAKLDTELADAPLIVTGSMGQEREHPLLSERRQQSAHLARLLGQLKLPDVDAGSSGRSSRSVQARDAALTRWGTKPDEAASSEASARWSGMQHKLEEGQ